MAGRLCLFSEIEAKETERLLSLVLVERIAAAVSLFISLADGAEQS